jgi:hypothetical protein
MLKHITAAINCLKEHIITHRKKTLQTDIRRIRQKTPYVQKDVKGM